MVNILLSLRLYFTFRTRERRITISRKGDTVLDDNSNVYFFPTKCFHFISFFFLISLSKPVNKVTQMVCEFPFP